MLPWRRWSLGEGEGTHRDHHQSDAESDTLKRIIDYDGSFTVNYTHCIYIHFSYSVGTSGIIVSCNYDVQRACAVGNEAQNLIIIFF